jgi:hypothetical protein
MKIEKIKPTSNEYGLYSVADIAIKVNEIIDTININNKPEKKKSIKFVRCPVCGGQHFKHLSSLHDLWGHRDWIACKKCDHRFYTKGHTYRRYEVMD